MPTCLSKQQLASFADNGFAVIPDVIDAGTLTQVRDSMDRRVRDLLRRYQKLGHGHGDRPGDDLNDKLIQLLDISPAAYQHLDISLPLAQDYAGWVADWQELFGDEWREEAGVYADASIFALLSHPNIVGIARQLLGEEVIASPVQHVRIKPPQRTLSDAAAVDSNISRTLWHQDAAVVDETANEAEILTVWIAITDATVENGCMQAVRGSHQWDAVAQADDADAGDAGLTAHCPGKGDLVGEIYIPDEAIDRRKLVPLIAKAGDVVLLHKRAIHGAGANTGDSFRWSFDLRYQPGGTPTGRSFFPATWVHSAAAPEKVITDAAVYKRRWLDCRDAILSGDARALFNDRWMKYSDAPICA